MSLELPERHRIERNFHDEWAETIAIEGIDPVASFRSSTALENAQALAWLGPLKGKRLLDLGCGMGDGAVYFALQGAQVTAVDISPGMVKVCQDLGRRFKVTRRLKASVAVGERLPYADKSFDLIYGNGVLHHLDLQVSGPEIARVLKPGGRAVFIEPLPYNPVIWAYRHMAAAVRTEAEAPLSYAQLRAFGAHFAAGQRQELHLTTLLTFLWFFFVERAHPSKVRYWKKLVVDGPRYQPVFSYLARLDRFLCRRFPFLRPLCWNVVACYDAHPRRKPQPVGALP